MASLTKSPKVDPEAPETHVIKGEVVSADMINELERFRATRALVDTDFAGQALLGRSRTGRRTYISRLNQAAEIWGFDCHLPEEMDHKTRQAILRERYKAVPWQAMRATHVELLKTCLMDAKKSFRTINLTLAAVRSVAVVVFQNGMMSGDDLKRIELVKGEKGKRLPAGRHVASGEIMAITEACAQDGTAAGVRDQAILALLYACGMRRHEVAHLQFENLGSDEDGRVIKLVGKNNKQRFNWPDDGTWASIDDWLAIRGDYAGLLFCPVNKAGRAVLGKGLSDQSIYKVVIKRIDQAGLANKTTPHDLRRSFVSAMLDKGKDMKIVADLVGHASVETTALYDRRGDRKRREAQAAMHWPYRPHHDLLKKRR